MPWWRDPAGAAPPTGVGVSAVLVAVGVGAVVWGTVSSFAKETTMAPLLDHGPPPRHTGCDLPHRFGAATGTDRSNAPPPPGLCEQHFSAGPPSSRQKTGLPPVTPTKVPET